MARAQTFVAIGVEMTGSRGYLSFRHDVHAHGESKGAVVKKLVESLVELIEELIQPAPPPRPAPVRVKDRPRR